MQINYRCKIEKQNDEKFLVTFPDFEEACTEGETFQEALLNAEEMLTLTIKARIGENIPFAIPTLRKDEVLIFPSLLITDEEFIKIMEKNNEKK